VTRKMLFVVFSDDSCRQTHALMYAMELHAKGHEVRLILEGTATQVLHELASPESKRGALLRSAQAAGVLVGACARASAGCASPAPQRKVTELATAHAVPLLADLEGHAGIERFVREGYEVVVF